MTEPKRFTVYRPFTSAKFCDVEAESPEDAIEKANALDSSRWQDTYEVDALGEIDEVHDEHGAHVWPADEGSEP